MNYQNIYRNLITKGRLRGNNKSVLGYYTERHHIIPKCMGGHDDVNNLVLLTAREHFVAHQLLIKIYPNVDKLVYAAHKMMSFSPKHKRNSVFYE